MSLENITPLNLDLLHRPISTPRPDRTQLIHDIHPLHHLAKHSVLTIQMRRRRQRNEELAAVRARAGVRHAESALAVVNEGGDDFVLKLAAVDAAAATTSARGVTALDHETLDDAVEDDVVVFACGGEGGEVVAGLE